MSDLPYTRLIKDKVLDRVNKIPIPETFSTEWKTAAEWMRGEIKKAINEKD